MEEPSETRLSDESRRAEFRSTHHCNFNLRWLVVAGRTALRPFHSEARFSEVALHVLKKVLIARMQEDELGIVVMPVILGNAVQEHGVCSGRISNENSVVAFVKVDLVVSGWHFLVSSEEIKGNMGGHSLIE